MSKSEKLKEQIANIRSFILALFALIVFALLKDFQGITSFIIAIVSVLSIGALNIHMNKKLDALEDE